MRHGGAHSARCGAFLSRPVRVVAVTAVLLLAPRPTAAQLVVGADATFASRYVWRGVSRVTDPVLQPSAYIALGSGSSFLTAGGWWNVELRRAGAHDHTVAGAGSRGVGETNVWLEYAARQAAFDWRVGLWHYRLEDSRSTGLPADFSTSELHASIATLHLPVLARLSGWFDVDRLRGGYYEIDAAYALGTHPLAEIVGSLFAGGRVGASHGLARAAAVEQPFYFRRDGIVYYELYAQIAVEPPLGSPRVVCTFTPRYEFARDPAARRESLDPAVRDRSRFFWVEISLSWRRRLAGKRP